LAADALGVPPEPQNTEGQNESFRSALFLPGGPGSPNHMHRRPTSRPTAARPRVTKPARCQPMTRALLTGWTLV